MLESSLSERSRYSAGSNLDSGFSMSDELPEIYNLFSTIILFREKIYKIFMQNFSEKLSKVVKW